MHGYSVAELDGSPAKGVKSLRHQFGQIYDRYSAHNRKCPDTGQAGNAIDFFVKIRGVTFNEAMTLLSAHK